MSDEAPQRETVGLTNERGETRQYETVASRLARFRYEYPGLTLRTELLENGPDSVIFKATIGRYTEPDSVFLDIATGHSEEFRDSSEINRTSCMENAETSAWGRALAAFGFGSPAGVATADEVAKAQRRSRELKDQEEREPGVLILLQNAAKNGLQALEDVWLNELTKPDRKACAKYMKQLKQQAEKAGGQSGA